MPAAKTKATKAKTVVAKTTKQPVEKAKIQVKALNPKTADTKYTGLEPEWHIQPEERRGEELLKAFNWYNYHYGRKDAKEMIAHWLDANDRSKDAKKYRTAPDNSVILTIAWLCRANLVGLQLTEHEQLSVENHVSAVINAKEEKKAEVDEAEAKSNKLTIQDHLREKASACAGEIEGMFDEFLQSGAKLTASYKPMLVLRGTNVSPQMISIVADPWKSRIQEFEEVLEGRDADLVEAYSHYNKTQIKAIQKFCELVVADCAAYVQVKKVERKPRAKKAVSPEKTAAKFKYLREFPQLNLKSENPAKLVGASEAWLYDANRRKLIYVTADSHVGTFTVKGASIIGYDANASAVKTLRKPAETLKELMSVGRPAARKLFKDLTTTPVKFNGRSNENFLILKAW